jgi:hypothetical protein
MQISEGVDHLKKKCPNFRLIKPLVIDNVLEKFAVRAELHDQIEVPIVLQKVRRGNNARVVKLAVNTDLNFEPR